MNRLACRLRAALGSTVLALAAAQAGAVIVPWTFTSSASFPDKTYDYTGLGGADFTFTSFALAETTFDFATFGCGAGATGPGTTIGIKGLLDGANVFSFGAAASCPAGSFSTVLNPFSSLVVDELVFSVPGLTAVTVKDLDLAPLSPVPEPTTAALLLAGLAGLVGVAHLTRPRA